MDWALDDIAVYKGPIGPLYHHCMECSAPGTGLLRCGGCLAVRYCCREHQVVHRPQHKTVCGHLKKMRAVLAKEEYDVRHATPDFMTPANAFETHVGHFWGLVDTRDYMYARMRLLEHLRLLGTLDSVREALDHMLDMLRLCRGDNQGVRGIVPTTMLRLDLDQECYDFVKWWEIHQEEGGNWADTHRSFRGADALEDPDFAFAAFFNMDHHVAILILKLKLLVDIRNLKVTRKISGTRHLPQEIWDAIEMAVVRSPLSIKLQQQSPESLYKTEMKLLDQIRKLGTSLASKNTHFMAALFDPDNALRANPSSSSMGSWREVAIIMRYAYPTLIGTEGLLDLLNDARTRAGGDLGNGSRVWEHIKEAAENAAHLGPRS